jgi:hypothetical protein
MCSGSNLLESFTEYVIVVVAARGSLMDATILRSLLFHCISTPIYEVKRPSQALCCPLGLIGCSPSLSPGLWAFAECAETNCINTIININIRMICEKH